MIKEHLFIVIGMEHYNPLGLIRTLGKNEIKPVFIAVKGKGPASAKSKYIYKLHNVETIEEGYNILLAEYGNLKAKPFVLATDDDIQSLIDKNYSKIKDKFIVFNASEDGRISKFMDKNEILLIAKKHGLNILPTIVAEHGEIPCNIEYPIITKSISPNIGGWKKDVHICYSEQDLINAYANILSPKVIIQKFLDKDNECCMEGFSINKGKNCFIPMAVKYNYIIPGYYSPYMTAYTFKDDVLKKKVESLIEDIGFEGMFDVEFLVDKNGNYYFSEINFRNSIWNYIATFVGMPYPILWAKAMLSGKIEKNWQKPIPDLFTAMSEPIDYALRVKKGNISLSKWLMDFRETNVLFYYDSDDPDPFIEMIDNWEVYS